MKIRKDITYRYSNEGYFDADTETLITEPKNAGEYELKLYLREQGYFVEDVSNNPTYWTKDIDLFIHNEDGTSTSIEVKWDGVISKTGNMFIETVTNMEKGKDGWFTFCEADYLYYGDRVNQLYYVIALSDLREAIEKNDYKERTSKERTNWGKDIKTSKGYLVPIDDFKDKMTVIKLTA